MLGQIREDLQVQKLYLMTISCSGKSYFANRHSHYAEFPIVDFSKINRAASKGREPESSMTFGEHYRERVINFLQGHDDQVCVLGRRGPPHLPMDIGVDYGVVLIPVENHIRNWNARKISKPSTRWKDFSDLKAKRMKLADYASERSIPIFESFEAAIETLARPPGEPR